MDVGLHPARSGGSTTDPPRALLLPPAAAASSLLSSAEEDQWSMASAARRLISCLDACGRLMHLHAYMQRHQKLAQRAPPAAEDARRLHADHAASL